MLGAAATLLAGQHVRVDIFHDRMSPPSKARIDLWGFYILLMPVSILMIWKAQGSIHQSWRILESSLESDGLPGVYLLKTSISIFCFMMLMQGLAIALRAAAVIRDDSEPKLPSLIAPLFSEEES